MAKILVVDDDPHTRRISDRTLGNAGHEVTTTISCPLAMDWQEELEADIVICDPTLGGMEGLNLISHIKGKYPATSVIAVFEQNRYAHDAHRLVTQGAGAERFLLKPLNAGELGALVQAILDGRTPLTARL